MVMNAKKKPMDAFTAGMNDTRDLSGNVPQSRGGDGKKKAITVRASEELARQWKIRCVELGVSQQTMFNAMAAYVIDHDIPQEYIDRFAD